MMESKLSGESLKKAARPAVTKTDKHAKGASAVPSKVGSAIPMKKLTRSTKQSKAGQDSHLPTPKAAAAAKQKPLKKNVSEGSKELLTGVPPIAGKQAGKKMPRASVKTLPKALAPKQVKTKLVERSRPRPSKGLAKKGLATQKKISKVKKGVTGKELLKGARHAQTSTKAAPSPAKADEEEFAYGKFGSTTCRVGYALIKDEAECDVARQKM